MAVPETPIKSAWHLYQRSSGTKFYPERTTVNSLQAVHKWKNVLSVSMAE